MDISKSLARGLDAVRGVEQVSREDVVMEADAAEAASLVQALVEIVSDQSLAIKNHILPVNAVLIKSVLNVGQR
jgi:hypothetical protein